MNLLRNRNEVYFCRGILGRLLVLAKNRYKKLRKINALLKDIARTPYEGIGKPEPLKHKYAGFWSRRMDNEHRLIYQYREDEIHIIKCRFHYD